MDVGSLLTSIVCIYVCSLIRPAVDHLYIYQTSPGHNNEDEEEEDGGAAAALTRGAGGRRGQTKSSDPATVRATKIERYRREKAAKERLRVSPSSVIISERGESEACMYVCMYVCTALIVCSRLLSWCWIGIEFPASQVDERRWGRCRR